MNLGIDGIEEAEEVGTGGSATVYRAHQTAFGRDVAVKVLHVRFGPGSEAERRRFERERIAVGRVSDRTGIVPVYGSGFLADGRPYLIMPFYEAGSLQDRLDRDGPLAWREAAELMVAVAHAVQRAHDDGVTHRDIKPANIMVGRDRSPLIGDFGVAQLLGSTTLFQSQTLKTTPAYAPPEVFAGEDPGLLGDVYGLGATLFALVNGSPAFMSVSGEINVLALMRRVEADPVPDLRERGVPDAVAAVVERAMAKDPAERHPTAAAWAAELQTASSPGSSDEVSAAASPTGDPPAAAPLPGSAPAASSPVQASMPDSMSTVPREAVATPIVRDADGLDEEVTPDRWSADSRAEGRRRRMFVAGAVLAVLSVVGAIAIALAGGDGDPGGDDAAFDDATSETTEITEDTEAPATTVRTTAPATTSPPTTTTTPPTTTPPTTQPPTDPLLVAPGAILQGTTVTLDGVPDDDRPAIEAALSAFSSRTGIGVELVDVDLGDTLEAGEPPDVVLTDVDEAADGSPLSAALPVPEEVNEFVSAAWKDIWMGMGRVDGVQYAVPTELTSVEPLLWFRPSAVGAADGSVPGTWGELVEMAAQMAADGSTPWCNERAQFGSAFDFLGWVEALVLLRHGPAVYEMWTGHEIPYDDPRVQAAWTEVRQMWDVPGALLADGALRPLGDGQSPEAVALAAGDCAMLVGSDFHRSVFPPATPLADGDPDGVDVGHLPSIDGDQRLLADVRWARVFRDAPEVRVFLAYLGSPQYPDDRRRSGEDPGPMSAAARQDDSLLTPVDRALNEIHAQPDVVRPRPGPTFFFATFFDAYLEDSAVRRFISGELDVAEATAKIEAELAGTAR